MPFLLSLLTNKFAIIGIAFALVIGFGAVQTHRFNAITAEYESFKVATKAAGIAAQQAADARIAADKERKEQSDAKYKTRIVALAANNERLRIERANRSELPASPPNTKCPDGLACFDRAILSGALQRLDAGVSGIIDEGDKVTLRLKLAVEWAMLPDYHGNK